MGFHKVPWDSMRFYGIPWGSMRFHEILWDSMRFRRVLWGSMEFHEIPWDSMRLYDVSVNWSVPTEANRSLTSYTRTPQLQQAVSTLSWEQHAIWYMIFFWWCDSIDDRSEWDASCIVLWVLPSQMVVQMQLADLPNSSTSSCTVAPAWAFAMIISCCIGVKLGPLHAFWFNSWPNWGCSGIVMWCQSWGVVTHGFGVCAWQPKLLN
jgi:hypothetical protein